MREVEREYQLGRILASKWMSVLKFTLDLEEFSYKENGRNDPRYKFFKKQLMSHSYDIFRQLMEEMEDLGVLQETEYDEDIKQGYQDNDSGGSGYLNTDSFNGWIKREIAKINKESE